MSISSPRTLSQILIFIAPQRNGSRSRPRSRNRDQLPSRARWNFIHRIQRREGIIRQRNRPPCRLLAPSKQPSQKEVDFAPPALADTTAQEQRPERRVN